MHGSSSVPESAVVRTVARYSEVVSLLLGISAGEAERQASELKEVRVGLGGRRAAALCSVRKL